MLSAERQWGKKLGQGFNRGYYYRIVCNLCRLKWVWASKVNPRDRKGEKKSKYGKIMFEAHMYYTFQEIPRSFDRAQVYKFLSNTWTAQCIPSLDRRIQRGEGL